MISLRFHSSTPRRFFHAALMLTATGLASLVFAEGVFDDQRKSLLSIEATPTEQAIHAILKAGLNEARPTEALALTERWLSQNSVEDPLLLYHAGQAAELAGDWNAAVALYRQYIKRADLSSTTAADAILASYTLQIDHLQSPESAYTYSRVEGHRLIQSPQARQFDRWFLDEAQRRGDLEAVALRLLSLVEAKVSDDELITLHARDWHWLLETINNGRLDHAPYSPGLIETFKQLAKATTFDRELALLMDWSVSVKAYNMALLSGEQAAAPIAESQALLASYPHHAERVQTQWAGSRGQHYRGDHRKYWPIDLQDKLSAVNAAASKLDPLRQASFYQSWSQNYYAGGPQLLNTSEARAWVLANPELANRKVAPSLTFDWHAISLDQAKQLAPLLAQNPSPEAAGIRAIATVSQSEAEELDITVDALLKTEAWRLNAADLPAYIDRLWHRAGRPGGNVKRDQLIARSKPLQDEINQSTLKKEDPANQRISEFKRLWQDYRSAEPKIPSVRSRLLKVLLITPEAIADLLSDPSVEAQLLAQEALATGISGTTVADKAYERYDHRMVWTDRYDPCIVRVAVTYRRSDPVQLKDERGFTYVPHPLAQVIEQALTEQLNKQQPQPWLVLAWLNTRFPEGQDSSIKQMQQLLNSPAWASMPYAVRYGARDWFKQAVMTPKQYELVQAVDAGLVCKPLLSLVPDTDATAVAAAIRQTLAKLQSSPTRLRVLGLDQLGKLPPAIIADELVLKEVENLCVNWRLFETDPAFGATLFNLAAAQKSPMTLHRLAPYLWRHTEVQHRTLPGMIRLAQQMLDVSPSASHTIARVGLQTIARHKQGHTYYNRETDLPQLQAIRGKAAIAMKLFDIPVPPSHPAYPIYQSQAEYLSGNVATARQLYASHAEHLLPVHRNLSIPYLLWVLQTTIDQRDEARQEELVKALLVWSQDTPDSMSTEQRISLDIAYGDIALQRGMLPEAHQIYSRARSNDAYAASFDRHQASLRLVRVQRIARDFDAALQTLMQLDSEKVPRLTTEAHFARAEVYYDMQEYQDSADEIVKVLERDPEHSDATILRGRVQLKLQRLIEATEVELGSTTKLPSLVPGEMLKVTLNDPTLTVSSGASDIEVVVWTTSGDKEYLLLRQFGDQKTKYRGDVRTQLGKPTADDGVLQVVGDDAVYYAYSERFRQKMVNLDENRGGPIQVASDAILMASARKLLSENEQRVADMQALSNILEHPYLRDIQRLDPDRYASIQAEVEERSRSASLEARVKPGNPIYLRVIDTDRSRTDAVDELSVSVNTSSGDVVGRVILKETGTHTGQFEGVLQTAAAQALAYASSSEAGLNPNTVISPRLDYPAWRPIANSQADSHFTVDLNDNAPIQSLTIDASEPGYQLKRFLVQTAMNPSSWTTVGTYPPSKVAVQNPWQPQTLVVMEEGLRAARGARSVYDQVELRSYLQGRWLANPDMAIATNVAGPSQALPASLRSEVDWSWDRNDKNPAVVVRFQAYFYEPASVTRQFELQLGQHNYTAKNKDKQSPPQYLLAVDGRVITSSDSKQYKGQINLKPGLHSLEIWATGWVDAIGFGRDIKLLANLNDGDNLVPCPDSYFDPATFPQGMIEHRNGPSTIKASEDNKQFTVQFAPQSRARLFRLLFVENQGATPSLKHLSLVGPDDKRLLPVKEDFAELRKNDVLEIITGDKVAVRYLDDRYVTEGKQLHERLLNVAFTDGTLAFADIEPRMDTRKGELAPYRETLLRFEMDKPLSIVVNDADMDQTPEPDTLKLQLSSTSGQQREVIATETGPATGTFRAWVTPTAQATQAKDKIEVEQGGRLTATYMDEDNLIPGVPYERLASISHAVHTAPRIEIAHATILPFEPAADPSRVVQPLNEDLTPSSSAQVRDRDSLIKDLIQTRYQIAQQFVGMDTAPEQGIEVVHGRHALIDIVAPHMALGEASAISVYVQCADQIDPGIKTFDLNTPGTLKYTGTLNAGVFLHGARERGGFVSTFIQARGSDYDRIRISQQQGRFRLAIPLIPGAAPTDSYADPIAFAERASGTGEYYPYGLVAKVGQYLHVGVSYKDQQGNTQWARAWAKVVTRPILDVMQEDYRQPISEAHVGEQLFIRVVDQAEDRTPNRDELRVYMQSKSGQKHYATLTETDFHSGIFKGVFQLTFEPAPQAVAEEGYDVRRLGFPVQYGDSVGVRYADAQGYKTEPHFITVAKGSDGSIAPFSKQYDDAQIAMQTQFAMAESYLELARRHRQLGEEESASREFDRARQLLASTVTQFNDPQTRSHAEYLLGNLTMEDAEVTKDKSLQSQRYQAALARYMTVTGSYADTEFASMAQFKIAVIYERLNEPDIAAQEYVKLAYKYPESEHLATAMARLGTHFQRKAVQFESKAKPLLEDEANKDGYFEGQALEKLAKLEYVKSAQIFERLQERFPSHELAGMAGLRAGQIYMRAADQASAINVLQNIYNNESYDGPTLRCEAMYWAGMCHVTLKQPLLAYSLFKRITYDFPESKWAAFARSQLSSEQMIQLDQKLEIERLEAGQ